MAPKRTLPDEGLRSRAEKRLVKNTAEPARPDLPPEEVRKLIHELQVHQAELEMQNEELRRAQLALADSQRKYANLFNFAPMGYVILDFNGSIREANAVAAEMLGVSKRQITGRLLSGFVLSPDKGVLMNILREVMSSSLVSSCCVQLKQHREGFADVQMQLARFEENDKPGPDCLVAMTDISVLKRLEREKAVYIRDLEEFGMTAAHELHAPLLSMAGFARLLAREYAGRLDAEGVGHLDIIVRNAEKMERLINGLVECSQASTRTAQKDRIDLAVLVRSAYGEVASPDDLKKVTLDIGPLPAATGDTQMLRQVFVKLLSNALKFTSPHGRGAITVGGSEGAGVNTYYVRDDGVGFDMAYADRLFHIFQRLHSSREFSGTGAGLSVARRIIERHGGRIWAEGKPGEGATFYFTLPAA